ncbi:MAG: hypothetical protein H6577_11220 [Lewinellaceae bacterium]|nr:hypothetical protein [Saprospiraceae bacterium]MCB9338685.1 hypothetical protein [Lewinellaceae bacterium]
MNHSFADLQPSSKQGGYGLLWAALCLAFLMGSGCGKRHNWWEHYRPESKDPYGTWLVSNLLKDYFPGQKYEAVKDSLAATLRGAETPANYVFIGSWLSLDSLEMDALLGFVGRGNTAFIACQQFPLSLLDTIGKQECTNLSMGDLMESEEYFFTDSMATLNFVHPELRKAAGYNYKFWEWQQVNSYAWDYLPPVLFCDSQTVFANLGTIANDTFINFAKASFGQGAFYLHSTPIAFTNYHLVREEGAEYVAKSFSHLLPATILWDDYTSRYDRPARSQRSFSESPLRYILSQPPLAWAWYTLLGMAILYLAFRARRRQRIIPVLEQNTNTSLEFIGTIGRLYFTQNNHKQLALQKMKLFLGFVRDRYHLPTRELDSHFAVNLAAISEVPLEVLEKILTLHRNIAKSGFVSENTLVDFHQLMERFYRQCK